VDYRLLECLSHTLEMVIYLKGAKEKARKRIRKDQKKLLDLYTDMLADQVLVAVAREGNHSGLVNWQRLVVFLDAFEWQKALDLLPVLGLWPAGPFIDDCPALERFEGREIIRERRPRD